jgi:aspartyl-tRNA(Asn)/glutamyl-tRNA(Gln) amidotransferase subunit A
MKLLGTSLVELRRLVENNTVSVGELTSYFQSRIKKYDKSINSFVHTSDSVDGFPLAIKDNFCTTGMPTTASSKVLDTFEPPYDATVIAHLKRAKFGILGKTNMDAWAHGSSTETSDYGVTRNPWDHERVAGGSSGGSAAATATYLTAAAIGSETAGSIRQPAAWCGIVGLKPTYGRVSRYGVVAMGSSWDCPGLLTLTVEDSAYLLGIIAGHDQFDATSSERDVPDYMKMLKTSRKFTIGVCRSYFKGLDDHIVKVLERAIGEFVKMGHVVQDVEVMSPEVAISVYTIVQRAEVSSNLGRYDGIRYGNDRSFFGPEAKRRIMLGTYTLSHGYYDAYYKKAEKVRMLIIQDFKRTFENFDVIIGPTTPCSATKIGDMEKFPFFGELMDQMNEPAAAAGIPAINIPAGLDQHGLPIGLQIMGNHFDEASLLNLAYQFEQATSFYGMREKLMSQYPD